ncbi:hypothetical protein [Marivita hallyeonensis]|uniref:Uncharacterized protein n=1 Tax=Marivita hallyeonensis TaxID=996342 RepID=A0A1M5MA44_9RHOB|nr:hypothetical protein [Marivita hallyeonensis]SHG74131.1 hypothetical protein SAMN05443551_0445 [Marivita hallyeonensis]
MFVGNEIRDAIEEVVRKELHPAEVVSIDVKGDFDHDGDEILRITVVFEAEGGRLNTSKVLGLPRHLREPLAKLQEKRFPILTYMKPDELDGAAA